MVELRIENGSDFLDAALAANEVFDGFDPWWRGHSVATWKLHPSVFRVDNAGNKYEQNIAQRFALKAPSRYPNCPDRNDAPRWLFLMQHYGLYTRLLDWTESILIATYFAVRDEQYHHEDGAVWALMGSNLNEDQTGNHYFLGPYEAPAYTLFREAFDLHGGKPSNTIVAISSYETDIRMMVQLSEFTLHGVPTSIEELPNSKKFLAKFVIPKAAKLRLKLALNLFGISESTLFPDLEHLAADLRKMRFEP
ncbi:MAG: FRG domain-containing protein [Proteobacteria bacterium]|nr:FRG domain-containing protein [Pseudomonadota bacterium]